LKARIEIIYDTDREAQSIYDGVFPDNFIIPQELMIETTVEGQKVISMLEWSGKNPKTFISTIDDLLFSIQIAERAINTIDHS
jgi:hypothetical protein